MDGTFSSLHLLVLAALFVGATDADQIASRLGLNVDDVTALLLDLEQMGAITVVPARQCQAA